MGSIDNGSSHPQNKDHQQEEKKEKTEKIHSHSSSPCILFDRQSISKELHQKKSLSMLLDDIKSESVDSTPASCVYSGSSTRSSVSCVDSVDCDSVIPIIPAKMLSSQEFSSLKSHFILPDVEHANIETIGHISRTDFLQRFLLVQSSRINFLKLSIPFAFPCSISSVVVGIVEDECKLASDSDQSVVHPRSLRFSFIHKDGSVSQHTFTMKDASSIVLDSDPSSPDSLDSICWFSCSVDAKNVVKCFIEGVESHFIFSSPSRMPSLVKSSKHEGSLLPLDLEMSSMTMESLNGLHFVLSSESFDECVEKQKKIRDARMEQAIKCTTVLPIESLIYKEGAYNMIEQSSIFGVLQEGERSSHAHVLREFLDLQREIMFNSIGFSLVRPQPIQCICLLASYKSEGLSDSRESESDLFSWKYHPKSISITFQCEHESERITKYYILPRPTIGDSRKISTQWVVCPVNISHVSSLTIHSLSNWDETIWSSLSAIRIIEFPEELHKLLHPARGFIEDSESYPSWVVCPVNISHVSSLTIHSLSNWDETIWSSLSAIRIIEFPEELHKLLHPARGFIEDSESYPSVLESEEICSISNGGDKHCSPRISRDETSTHPIIQDNGERRMDLHGDCQFEETEIIRICDESESNPDLVGGRGTSSPIYECHSSRIKDDRTMDVKGDDCQYIQEGGEKISIKPITTHDSEDCFDSRKHPSPGKVLKHKARETETVGMKSYSSCCAQ
ncbi:hypothetical protein ADUPG1_010584 [Aduncisulcus paluster]|uniref:Uncharacterized protein n=1 Tax=Aduncisulcus paluster TaxID=2918883 RepID=A0ABQ5JXB2_9EUKA|nr:hypothetical protein ADUPG1_010584 [Aduncisulcus paluster]